jgi:nitrate reductase beta subunit
MVLEDAKMVATIKGVEHGRPQTVCRITPLGRKRYIDYLAVLEQVVLDASSAIKADTPPRGGHNPANA